MNKKEVFTRVGNGLSDKEREIVDKMKCILAPMGWSIRCDTRPHGLLMWLSHEDLLMRLEGMDVIVYNEDQDFMMEYIEGRLFKELSPRDFMTDNKVYREHYNKGVDLLKEMYAAMEKGFNYKPKFEHRLGHIAESIYIP